MNNGTHKVLLDNIDAETTFYSKGTAKNGCSFTVIQIPQFFLHPVHRRKYGLQ